MTRCASLALHKPGLRLAVCLGVIASCEVGHALAAPPPAPRLMDLQRYDLAQLHLMFTNTGTPSPVAMVIDPQCEAHLVRVGDFIGRHGGRVSGIKRDEVIITEPDIGRSVGIKDIHMRMTPTDMCLPDPSCGTR